MNKLILLSFIVASNLYSSSTLVLLKDDGINGNVDNYMQNYNNSIISTTNINESKNITETIKKPLTVPSKIKLIDGFINCLDVIPGAYETFNGVQYYAASSTFDIESKINEGFVANNICTTHITNMDNLLINNLTFNQPINQWDTSNVTSMIGMLKGSNNYNQDLSMWNVSNVASNHKGFASGSFIYGTNKSPFPADLNIKLNANGVTIECDDATPGSTETFNGVQYYIALNKTDLVSKINSGFVANNICTTHVSDMSYLTWGINFFNQPIDSWDTKNVTDMSYAFYSQRYSYYNGGHYFNQNISMWDVSKVTNFDSMFRIDFGPNVFNQNISSWNTSSATNMNYMFYGSPVFDQDIHNWNVTNVTSHIDFAYSNPIDNTSKSPFYIPLVKLKANGVTIECPDAIVGTTQRDKDGVEYYIAKGFYYYYGSYNDIKTKINSGWPSNRICTTKAISLEQTFISSTFNGDISNWDTSNITSLKQTFYGSQFNGDLSNWDTSKVIDMYEAFSNTTSFQGLGISNWNTSNVTDTGNMFYNATNFNQSLNWNTSKVSNMSGMFAYATLFNQPLSLDTSSVIDMSNMFAYASNFNQPLNFNTINVKSMSNMFAGATSFNSTLTFNTSNVQTMVNMFYRATSFNQPLNFDTGNVVYTNYMFAYATLFNQNINNWNITKSNDANNHNGFGKDSPIEFDFLKNPYLYIQSNYNGNI